MKTKQIMIAFVVMALIQLAIPAKMVYENETTYAAGVEYKFKVRPIDPADPFRGKYIELDFAADTVHAKEGQFEDNQKVYALLGKDKEGFAKVTKLQAGKPQKGDYILVDLRYNYDGTQHFNYPFNRFYMEESKAPIAEAVYAESLDDKYKIPTYAIVAVRGEVAVVKDVIVGGIPVKEYVEKHRNDYLKK